MRKNLIIAALLIVNLALGTNIASAVGYINIKAPSQVNIKSGTTLISSVPAPQTIQGVASHPATATSTACTGIRNFHTYNDMQMIGLTKQRTDLYVQNTEATSSGSFVWTGYDCMVSDGNALGIDTTLVVNGRWPDWGVNPSCAPVTATSTPNCPPNDATTTNALIYNYCFAAGTHFNGVNGPLVTNFEVWNEVGGGTWLKTFGSISADMAAYVAFNNQCYNGFHDARGAGIANVNVMPSGMYNGNDDTSSGLSYTSYYSGLFADGALHDSMAIHPYSQPNGTASSNWTYIANTLRPLMISNGFSSQKIWITEVGWATCGPGVPLDLGQFLGGSNMKFGAQRDGYMQVVAALKTMSSYMGPTFIYTLFDDNSNDHSSEEECFGILYHHLGDIVDAPKVGYDAIHSN